MKSIFSSWTVWFGLCQILLGGVGYFSGQMNQTESWTLVTTGFGTVALRFKTSQPII